MLRRTLARLDVSSRTLFAIIDQGSCFAGTLFELALAADRSYMLLLPQDEPARRRRAIGDELRRLPDGESSDAHCHTLLRRASTGQRPRAPCIGDKLHAALAQELGSGDLRAGRHRLGRRSAHRRSRSAPASRRMRSPAWRPACASPAPRRMETRIFGRLSAWQNWIFNRPNAVGEQGALKVFGTGSKAKFNWERV